MYHGPLAFPIGTFRLERRASGECAPLRPRRARGPVEVALGRRAGPARTYRAGASGPGPRVSRHTVGPRPPVADVLGLQIALSHWTGRRGAAVFDGVGCAFVGQADHVR